MQHLTPHTRNLTRHLRATCHRAPDPRTLARTYSRRPRSPPNTPKLHLDTHLKQAGKQQMEPLSNVTSATETGQQAHPSAVASHAPSVRNSPTPDHVEGSATDTSQAAAQSLFDMRSHCPAAGRAGRGSWHTTGRERKEGGRKRLRPSGDRSSG